ncbi:MAG: zf-HC2 domain-containing protein [Planctomycetia bacterium]|nr:zf-HC2 domain-containing protein [Planctomycetia bacterium]
MKCEEVRRHWDLYYDSEGDAELHFQINEHLDNCPGCAEWFHKQGRLEDLLSAKVAAVPGDEQLWEQVLQGAMIEPPAPAGRRFFLLTTLAACAAAIVLGFFAVLPFLTGASSNSESLSALTATWHERLVAGQVDVPCRSESDLAVEDFLRKRVSFPVRCPPRKDAGFAVSGAGTCRLGDQPAAYLVGDVDEAPVTIFILSRDSLPAFPHQQAALQSESVHRCREGEYAMALSVIDRNLVLVVGRTDAHKLARVLSAYGTYPHRPAG